MQGIRDYTTVAAGVPIPKAPGTRNNYDGSYDFSNPEVLYGTFRGEYDLTSYLTGFIAVGGSERSTRYISTNRTIIDALGPVNTNQIIYNQSEMDEESEN